MQRSLYFFLINCSLILYLNFFVSITNQLILFCLLFNIVNIYWVSLELNKKNNSINYATIINYLFNFSAILFLYPDLLVSDPKLFFYGEEFSIVQAFKLMIYYQFIITIALKYFENLGFGNLNLNNFKFFKKYLIKSIIEINIISLFIYLFSGNQLTSILSGRADGEFGSFFKIPAYSGGTNSFFILFNFLIQFTAVVGSLYLLNYIFTRFIKGVKIELLIINIPNLYKFILSSITVIFYISAFFSDVRINLLYVIFPTIILFTTLISVRSNLNNKFSLITIRTAKIITLGILIIIFLLISQIQVYRRAGLGATFFQRERYEITKTQGVVQTDRNLYMLSELIKFTPNNGTSEGKQRFSDIPYQFVPSLIYPNKKRFTKDKHEDVDNSIVKNFSYEFTNTSLSFTCLGEFIHAYGKNLGFILAATFTILISYLNILILSKFSSSIFYPYLAVSSLSVYFLLCRSLFYYITVISMIIYSLFVLFFYMKLRKSY